MPQSVIGLWTMFLLFCYNFIWENFKHSIEYTSKKKGANTHFYDILVTMMMIW